MCVVRAAVAEKAMQLLAAEATMLAPAADANVIALVMADFTPAPERVLADFELATFTGSTPQEIGVGTQPEGIDGATGEYVIDRLLPAGGLRFETTALTNLPQTIYGWVEINDAGTQWQSCGKLDEPIVLTVVNQRVVIGQDDVRIAMERGAIH